MITKLQLNNYYVEELVVRENPAFDAKARERKEGTLNCSVGIATANDKHNFFKLVLDVSVDPSSGYPSSDAYQVKVRVVGFFQADADLASGAAERMAAMNGTNVLLGIARGFVAQATGIGQHGKYLLPLLNLQDLIKEKVTEPAGHEGRAVAQTKS